LYLLSLGEEMARPDKRRRAHSGNVNRRTCKAMRAMGVTCKQPASPATMKKDGRRLRVRCSVCPTAKQKKRLELLPVLGVGVQEPVCQDSSNKIWQLTGTVTVDRNSHSWQEQSQLTGTVIIPTSYAFFFLNCSLLSSKVLCISLCMVAWEMRNLKESSFFCLWVYESNLGRQILKKIIWKVWVQDVPSTIGSYFAP